LKTLLTLSLIALFSTTNAFAEGVSCETSVRGDPNPDVEKALKDSRCALVDAFENSCAYRDFLFAEESKKIGGTAKAWAERTARIFDPAATFEDREVTYKEIHAVTSSPGFLSLYQDWLESGKPEENSTRSKSGRLSKHSFNELRSFYRAVSLMKATDPTRTLFATLDLVATLPAEGQSEYSPKNRQALLEKIYREGLNYKASHSVGCGKFVVKTQERSSGTNDFGPVLKSGQRQEYPEEKKAALEKSLAETKKFQSSSGVLDDLKACREPYATTAKTVGVVVKSCDVDLPMIVFRDNRADIKPETSKVLTDAIAKDPCYLEAVKKGLKVSKVAIATSANTLNNTENYCKRGFLDLSRDRAASVRGVMTDFFGENLPESQENYPVSFKGSNGDGTSGPCAYVAKEKKNPSPGDFEVVTSNGTSKESRFFSEERSVEFSGPKGEAKLEKNKFAKTTIYFEESSSDSIANGSTRWVARASCRTIQFDCK
jgi:hypothetical protein